MKVGLFTALLAKLSLDEVIEKVKPLGIQTLELGTGNYPGEPHLKLEWLHQPAKLKEFKQKLEDEGISISALSCHGNPLHPNKAIAKSHAETSRKTILLAEKLGVKTRHRFLRLPGRFGQFQIPQLVADPLASRLSGNLEMAVGEESHPLLDEARQVCGRPRRARRHRDASGLRGL